MSAGVRGSHFTEPASPGVVNGYVIGPVDADAPLDDVTLDHHYPFRQGGGDQ